MSVVILVFLVSIYSPIYGGSSDDLEQTQISFSSQGNETSNVSGCTNISANNFNENATEDDGTCDFDLDDDGVLDYDEVDGCTNSNANNFDINATDDDGSCTYSGSENGSFRHEYWQGYIHGALIRQHEPSFVKFSPDGVFYATHHDGTIKIWTTATVSTTHAANKTISQFTGGWVVDLDWAPDGSHLAMIVTDDLSDRGWPVRWTSSVITYNLESEEFTTLGTHYYNTNYDIGYSPDGSFLGAALGNEIVVYDLLNGEKFLNYSSHDCTFLCNTYDYISWGTNSKKMTLAWNLLGFISIYDLDSQLFVNQSEVYYRAESLEFSPDGNTIAACTDDGDVALFNSTDLSMLWELSTSETNYWYQHNSACNEIAWSPDSTKFAIANDGNGNHGSSVLIYDAITSDVLDWFSVTRPYDCDGWNCASIEGLDWSPDGNKIILAADLREQGIHTWIYDANIEFIPGCTDYTAQNYDANATRMDYSCEWVEETNSDEDFVWVSDGDEENVESKNSFDLPSLDDFIPLFTLVFFIIIMIIICVVSYLNSKRKNSVVSSIANENQEDAAAEEEHADAVIPMSIEINVRELV